MKQIYSLVLGCAALLSTFSCSDDKFSDHYQNPEPAPAVTWTGVMV